MVKTDPSHTFFGFVESEEVEVWKYSDDVLTGHTFEMKSGMELLMIMHVELALLTAAISTRRTGWILLVTK